MNIKKFISLLLIVVVLFSVCSLSINTKAETSKNILLGILPKASTTDNWMLDNRPLSNITDGTSTTLTDDNNAWGSPGRLDNVKGESYSWYIPLEKVKENVKTYLSMEKLDTKIRKSVSETKYKINKRLIDKIDSPI